MPEIKDVKDAVILLAVGVVAGVVIALVGSYIVAPAESKLGLA